MSQAHHGTINLSNAGIGTDIHCSIPTILTCPIRPNRRLPVPTPVGAESSIAQCIQFYRWLRAYFLNVYGNGDGRGQEDG